VKFRVLVVDDEPSITRSLDRVLTDHGYQVFVAATGAAGLELMERERPHIVLLDVRLPDASGFDLIPRIQKIETGTQIIVITGLGDTKSAVRAIKLGATDFLRKPYDLDELILAVQTAARSFARDAHLNVYRRKDRGLYNPDQIVYRSEVMTRLWDLVRKVARSDAASVLITGETGTGKELVARGIHFEGHRRRAPFMGINCSAFQDTLLENELFGHEKGAYTGAAFLKRGLVELSDGGTLFLDEVGESSLQIQAKLLRFLEDRSFKRVGGSVDLNVDIRVVAATNVDLGRRIEEERFRSDLFYRLQVLTIHLPPLRERGEDILLLAEHFLRKFATEMRRGFRTIEEDACRIFSRYAWPGNIRELRNLIERIVLVEDDTVLRVHHLPREMVERAERAGAAARPAGEAQPVAGSRSAGEAQPVADSRPAGEAQPVAGSRPAGGPGEADVGDEPADGSALAGSPRHVTLRSLREVQEEHVCAVLAACGGNKSRAARILGLSRQGLLDFLKRLDARQGTDDSRRQIS